MVRRTPRIAVTIAACGLERPVERLDGCGKPKRKVSQWSQWSQCHNQPYGDDTDGVRL